jgi:hypothetical protein
VLNFCSLSRGTEAVVGADWCIFGGHGLAKQCDKDFAVGTAETRNPLDMRSCLSSVYPNTT